MRSQMSPMPDRGFANLQQTIDNLRRQLAERTGGPVAVTLGARGALLVDGQQLLEVPAPLVQPVDTTGAGDVFTGVLAAALADGQRLELAARWAVHAASWSTEVQGARGAPDRGGA